MFMKSRQFSVLATLLVVFGLAACAEIPSGPSEASLGGRSAANVTPDDPTPLDWDEKLWVCKVGTDANVEVSVDGAAPTQHSVADGECKVLFNWPGLIPNFVTVSELADASYTLDSIKYEQSRNNTGQGEYLVTGTNSVTVEIVEGKGARVIFFNSPKEPPPPPAGMGCTPGYWRQSQHFDSWTGYAPGDAFATVFGVSRAGTLLDNVWATGGGANALARHAVAALLNAASGGVDYPYTTAEVIAAVQAAFASGDFEATKDLFEAANEAGCPLN
jgi:hypothetical protein